MAFHLADEQAEAIKPIIEIVKSKEEFKYIETFANTNSNGNALYFMAMEWAKQNK
jgi:hypothetical protein